MVCEQPRVAGEERRLEEDPEDLLEDAAGEIRDRVAEPVGIALEEACRQELNPDECEENRDGEVNDSSF